MIFRDRMLSQLAGFVGGFLAPWICILAFDVAFILGFVRHVADTSNNAILLAAGAVVVASLIVAVMKRKLPAWCAGFISCFASMFFGLWELTGSLAQAFLP